MSYFNDYKETSAYGWRIHPTEGTKKFHNGVDTAFPMGTEVQSLFSGTVERTGFDKSAGNYVVIKDNNGSEHKFFHLSKINVSKGDNIDPSSVLGLSGSTGNSTGAHLHYEVRDSSGNSVNPYDYYKNNANTATLHNGAVIELDETGKATGVTIGTAEPTGFSDWIMDFLGEVIYFIVIIAICVLGVILFLKAFDIKVKGVI